MENRLVEINEKSYTLAGELHVRKELRFVHWKHPLHGFQLNHNFFSNNEIDAIFPSSFPTFVNYGQLNLRQKW